ncbi:MAG: hypothetical protein KF802_08940 [Bdellovibrionaceae bacterium]|nr:hypothetical protein [Pseudobdellovibrionaceae bacterium]
MPNFRKNIFLGLIFLLCGISSAWAKPSQSEIAFQNSSIHFQATKTKSKFTFSDNLGPRSLEIKKCNRKVVEDFWQGLVKSVNSLQGSGIKERLPSSNAWVKFEGVKFQVLDFEPAIHVFNKAPNNSQVLFSESRRLCKK